MVLANNSQLACFMCKQFQPVFEIDSDDLMESFKKNYSLLDWARARKDKLVDCDHEHQFTFV